MKKPEGPSMTESAILTKKKESESIEETKLMISMAVDIRQIDFKQV